MSDVTGLLEQREIEVDGVVFDLFVYDDPSGLRGQVFHGAEKVAGSVQVYHRKEVDRLVTEAQRDPAVRRAAERLRA